MRRLLIVSLSPALGGAERSMLLLARHLPDHGWHAVLACPPGELARHAVDARITVEVTSWRPVHAVSTRTGDRKRYPLGGLAAAVGVTVVNAARTAALARRMRVDAILSNSLHAHPFVTFGGRLAGRFVVWHLRDIVDPGPGRRLLTSAARRAHGVLAVSQAVAATVRHQRTLVLHNPVEAPARAVQWEPPGRVVGFIGRIDPEKGLDELVRAAELVDATFVVAGEPRFAPDGYLDRLRATADELSKLSRNA
jgi:glycosyltransferase involved in cell wall biosynthesis